MDKLRVCLLNDAFYPTIDGVSTVLENYSEIIRRDFGSVCVVTPSHPDADDSAFPFPLIRYPSIRAGKLDGYRAGYPLSPTLLRKLTAWQPDILHTHCPIISTFIARMMRDRLHVPVVLTYHTKFDIEIAKSFPNRALQKAAIRAMVNNIDGCDEIWAVSRGACDNLRGLGYAGDIRVMPNGVDLPKGKVDRETQRAAMAGIDLPEGVPVFLFVGRMMWYKGIRLILDALAALQEAGRDFRMIFLGSSPELGEIRDYAAKLRLDEKVRFCPAIHDRTQIRAWYSAADLFLFPSSFDTSGLVVQEAAACGVASVMLRDSCVAENATDGVNGFLIDETSASLTALLLRIMDDKALLASVGEGAQRDLYLSWQDAVSAACVRYRELIELNREGRLPRHRGVSERFLQASSRVMTPFGKKP